MNNPDSGNPCVHAKACVDLNSICSFQIIIL